MTCSHKRICADVGGIAASHYLVRRLPPHVQRLWPGERELAAIVFARGPSTAADVRERLSKDLTNSSVRATLNRLVAKGILELRPGRRGRGNPAVYCPTNIPEEARTRAVMKVCDDYFGGSPLRLALAALATVRDADEHVSHFVRELQASLESAAEVAPGERRTAARP
jgi:predicted transcriptional regulator